MAQTAAERQAAFRKRVKETDDRLSTHINKAAKKQLERISGCYDVTQKEALERLLDEAEKRIIDRVRDDRESRKQYFAKKLKLEPEPFVPAHKRKIGVGLTPKKRKS